MKRLYHFTLAKYAFDDMRNRRLKIAQLDDLNDPFEFRSVNLCDPVHAQAFEGSEELGIVGFLPEMARLNGVLCFSENKVDLLQWAHYADRHKGICLGFDVRPEGKFGAVRYVTERVPFPEQLDEYFVWQLLITKSADWICENEWRVFARTTDGISDKCTGRVLYFADFGSGLVLREVILGARNTNTADEVQDALKGYPEIVDVRRMHLCCGTFELEERPANLL
jgi:Protein of unknown function (DUF2971)